MPTRIKRYEERAERLDALLARIEAEMGPEAAVERRDFMRGRILGLFGGVKMVEVIATVEIDATPGAFAHPTGPALPIPSTLATQPQYQPDADPPPSASSPEPGPPAALEARFDMHAAEPAAPDSWTPEPAVAAHVVPRIAPSPPAAATAQNYSAPPPAPAAQQPAPAGDTAQPAPVRAVPEAALAAPVAPADAAGAAAAATAGSELQDLKTSISELQQTMRLLIEQQQLMLSAAAAPPAAAPAALEPEPAPEPEPHALPKAPASAPEPDGLEAMAAPAKRAAAAKPGPQAAPRVLNPMAIDPAALLEGIQRGAYERLLDWNIGPYDALELINAALLDAGGAPPQDTSELLARVTREVCRNVLLSGGIMLRKSPPGKVVALVGATGVGKTTTIAKLAANFAFQQGKRVSLVSLDNYRIAAAEQLRTYTDIMGIDLDIVFSREEFDQVLSLRRHNDLVLIDTAGRSPLNEKQIYELREIFSAHPPDEVHLVIAAPTKADDLRLILENFLPLSYDYVIVSKLDETRSLGCLYNISRHAPAHSGRAIPISYFTVGQSVPEDIRTAELPFIQAWIEQGRIV
jgi:flagellar biosynthesis protein FlhF